MRARRDFIKAIAGATTVSGLAGCTSPFPATPDDTPEPTETPTPTPTTPAPLPEPGTDLETDTSGDGFPDLILTELGLDPYLKHVFLEIDVIGDADYEPLLHHMEEVLAQAPIENIDGSTGIERHYTVDTNPLPDGVTGTVGSTLSLAQLRFGHHESSTFQKRHRGYRHVIITDDGAFSGGSAQRFVLAVDTQAKGQLTQMLLAQMSGRFNPFIDDDLDPAHLEADADPQWFVENVDWDLIVDTLPRSTPSIRYLERKYAHLADDRDVDIIESPPENPAPDHDTSGDGIADRLIHESPLFEGADPLRRNLFFEVHHTPLVTRSEVETQLHRLETFFDNAPIRNPDGSMGVDLHFLMEGEFTEFEEPITESELAQTYWNYFDTRGKGYYFLLFVDELEGLRGRAVEELLAQELDSTTLLHEIGHGLGIRAGYVGVDDHQRSFDEYPSVMNYHAPRGTFTFAADVVEDPVPVDWEIIDGDMSENTPSTHRIEL